MSTKHQNKVLSIINMGSAERRKPVMQDNLTLIGVTPDRFQNLLTSLEETFDIVIPALALDQWIDCKDVVMTVEVIIAGENPCWGAD